MADVSDENTASATSWSRLFDREPSRWVIMVLVCLALFVRGRAILALPLAIERNPERFGSIAWNLRSEHTFAYYYWHFSEEITTASRPPLYAILLTALIYAGLELDDSCIRFLNALLGAATVWATWRLARSWNLSVAASLLGAALVLIDPLLLMQAVLATPETLATLLAVLSLLALTHAGREPKLRWSLLAGAILGLAILCRPAFFAFFVVVVAAFPFVAGGSRRMARLCALLVAAAVVLAPWAERNRIVFGLPIFTTTSGGPNLLRANNEAWYEDLRTSTWTDHWDSAGSEERELDPVELIQVRRGLVRDEVGADTAAYAAAWQAILGDPAMFAYASFVRLAGFWSVLPPSPNHQDIFPYDESSSRRGMRYATAIWYAFELPLAILGLWSLRRGLLRSPWKWGLLLCVSYTAVHAIYWSTFALRAPLTVVVALAAAQGVISLANPPNHGATTATSL